MQTFLPYSNFERSANCLDNKRLGKQRSEALIIYNVLTQNKNGWKNHPAVLMWKNYESALGLYYNIILKEWEGRGFVNKMEYFGYGGHGQLRIRFPSQNTITMPPWLGDDRFHASHRSNLLRKDLLWYSKFGWTELIDLPYFWPTKNGY